MEKLIKYKDEIVPILNLSIEERFNFFTDIDDIQKKDISEIEKTKQAYLLNFKLLEKLSRGKFKADDLLKEDSDIVDDLIIQFQNLLTQKFEKKN